MDSGEAIFCNFLDVLVLQLWDTGHWDTGTVKFNMCVSSLHGALPVCRNRKMRGGEGRKSVRLQIVKKRRGNLHVVHLCNWDSVLLQPKDIVLRVSWMALQIRHKNLSKKSCAKL